MTQDPLKTPAPSALSRSLTGAVIPVGDLDRSIAFYRDALGLSGEPTPSGYRLRAGAGSVLYLLPDTDYPGTAAWPLASFETADIEAAVTDLARRGVPLLRDVPFDLDTNGIHTGDGIRIAWLTDPDGQTLTIFQLTDHQPATT